MNRFARFGIASLVFAVLFGAAQPCAAVALRGETEVSRPTVRLSDVFDGLPDGIDCDIARAPQPGRSITYDVNVLNNLVRQYHLDWKAQSPAEHMTITTVGTRVTNDDIRAAVLDKLKSYDIQGDIEVAFDNRILDFAVPTEGSGSFALNDFSLDTASKRFRAELSAQGFSGPINMPVMGHITVLRNVPVLAHRLDAGTLIAANDIDWIKVPDDRSAGVVADADKLINHELRREMAAGQPINPHDVAPPRLVVRGALVTMKIETPYMVITAQGRALQDGKLGDVVRINNIRSNRMVEGVVDGAGSVCIGPKQKLAAADLALKGEQ